jgi:hypothetical protein
MKNSDLKNMTTGINNTTIINSENIFGCMTGEGLYIPFHFASFEGEKNFVLRFIEENDFDIFDEQKFINELNFAINVTVSNGWDGMVEHLHNNGFKSISFTGLLPINEFLANTSKDLLSNLDLTLFNV